MKIRSANFLLSAHSLDACPESKLPEFAFIGRSNVGKSSLLNSLVGRGKLARVSVTPGRTREINFFNVNDEWTLVDLPGYGYAKASKADRARFNEFVTDYLIGRRNLCCALVLIDARHPPQRIDLEFVRWLVDHAIPFALVFTKLDKVKAGVAETHGTLFKEAMAAWSEGLPEIFATSAKTGAGRADLLRFIGTAVSQSAGLLTEHGPD